MLTISLILVLLALGCTVANAMGKCPIWVPVFLVVVVLLLGLLPIR